MSIYLRRLCRWLAADLRWLLVSGLAAGMLLRLMVAASPRLGRINADQAVLYLTARHVSNGEYTAFFWGQTYGGSALQTVLGAVFMVTGPHLWMLPLAVGLISTSVALLTWRVGVAAGSPTAGALAGAALAVAPPTWVFFGVASEPFYTVGLAASLGSLLLALRPAALTSSRALVIGLLVGFAVWQSPFSVLTTLPTAVLLSPLLARRPGCVVQLVLGVLIGVGPVLRSVLLHDAPLGSGFRDERTTSQLLEAAVTGAWTQLFTRFAPAQLPVWLLQAVVIVGLLVAVGAGLRQVARLANGRADLLALALLVPVVLWIPFHMHQRLPHDAPASRYAMPLLPYIALWTARRKPAERSPVPIVTALCLYSGAGLWQASGDWTSPHRVLHSPAYAALAEQLLRDGRSAVYADYWIAYRLTAESHERILAHPPSMPRYPRTSMLRGRPPAPRRWSSPTRPTTCCWPST